MWREATTAWRTPCPEKESLATRVKENLLPASTKSLIELHERV